MADNGYVARWSVSQRPPSEEGRRRFISLSSWRPTSPFCPGSSTSCPEPRRQRALVILRSYWPPKTTRFSGRRTDSRRARHQVAFAVVGPWRQRLDPGVTQRVRWLYPDDWACIAELDEFHEYPDGLPTVIEYCTKSGGYDAVLGDLADRIGPEGTLPTVTRPRVFWDHVPLGGDVTGGLPPTPGVPPFYSGKVVFAAKGSVLGLGTSLRRRGNDCPIGDERTRPPLQVGCHLGRPPPARYDLYTGIGEPYASESKTFEQRIAERGFIDISDPRLRIRHVRRSLRRRERAPRIARRGLI